MHSIRYRDQMHTFQVAAAVVQNMFHSLILWIVYFGHQCNMIGGAGSIQHYSKLPHLEQAKLWLTPLLLGAIKF